MNRSCLYIISQSKAIWRGILPSWPLGRLTDVDGLVPAPTPSEPLVQRPPSETPAGTRGCSGLNFRSTPHLLVAICLPDLPQLNPPDPWLAPRPIGERRERPDQRV